MTEERLVVEVVAAHNLMPKDGRGSSSSFFEVEFEHQRRRTSVKHKDLNPVWNERLLFAVSDPADLPYRAIDVGVYNERSSASSRNFLGKVRVSAAGVPAPGEDPVPQLFTLEKRSLFSHIRGEISLKIYRVYPDEVCDALSGRTPAPEKKKKKDTSPEQRKKQQPPHPAARQRPRPQQHRQKQREINTESQMQPHQTAGKQHPPPGPAMPVDFKSVGRPRSRPSRTARPVPRRRRAGSGPGRQHH